MKTTRRRLLLGSLGAAQFALLSRFGYKPAQAAPGTGFPTKLLLLHIEGGMHFESLFAAMSSAGIQKHIPAPYASSANGNSPAGYNAAMVRTLDNQAANLAGNSAAPRRIAMPIYWDWANPDDHDTGTNPQTGTDYFRYGYGLADPVANIYQRMAVIVGVDQGSAAHTSAKIASFCGVAGENYRAPSIAAVVAHALSAQFPDRILPSVQLGGIASPSISLPSAFSSIPMSSPASASLSFTQNNDTAWLGLRERTASPRLDFDGNAIGGELQLTRIEELLLEKQRTLKGSGGAKADALLREIHDGIAQSSVVLAKDVLDQIANTPGFEHLQTLGPRYASPPTACLEGASSCWNWADGKMGAITTALKLLKSDLSTSVTVRMSGPDSENGFDTHNGGAPDGGVGFAYSSTRGRATLEEVARLLIEMSLTPSTVKTGNTLLDDTLVYICSDFGRSFPLAGDDHHPATVAMLVGGCTKGDTMVGAWDEGVPVGSSPMGIPTAVTEEDGATGSRLLRAQDVAATVYASFGLQPGTDFFLPGGYGIVNGVIES